MKAAKNPSTRAYQWDHEENSGGDSSKESSRIFFVMMLIYPMK